MTREELRAFCELLMCSDPWPRSEENESIVKALVNSEARAHGYENWVEAFHGEKKSEFMTALGGGCPQNADTYFCKYGVWPPPGGYE